MVLPGGKNFLYRLSRQYEKQFAERSNETLPLRLYVLLLHAWQEREKKKIAFHKEEDQSIFPLGT